MIPVNKTWHKGITHCVELACTVNEAIGDWLIITNVPEGGSSPFRAGEAEGASGKLLFTEIAGNVKRTLDICKGVLSANFTPKQNIVLDIFEKATTVVDDQVLDELAFRQRKLFESLLAIIAITNPLIVASGKKRANYQLHYQLVRDIEHLERKQSDHSNFFFGENNGIEKYIDKLTKRVQVLEKKLNAELCVWGQIGVPVGTTDLFTSVMKSDLADPLEKAALGLSNRTVYSLASSRIHLDTSRFVVGNLCPPTQRDKNFALQFSIEYAVLLCCAILRRIAVTLKRLNRTLFTEVQELIDLFADILPNDYTAAFLASAEIGDIVYVNHITGSFVGIVELVMKSRKSKKWKYASYSIKNPDTKVSDSYPSLDVTVLLRKNQIADFENNSRTTGKPMNERQLCAEVKRRLSDFFFESSFIEQSMQNNPVDSVFLVIGGKL